MREVPANPLAGPLQLLSPGGPQPTPRTMLLVRRYNLEEDLKHNSLSCWSSCTRSTSKSPRPTSSIRCPNWPTWPASGPSRSIAAARWSCTAWPWSTPTSTCSTTRFGRYRNPYDPEFRGACDLYNGALESMLRIIKKQGEPGARHDAHDPQRPTKRSKPRSCCGATGWRAEDFEGFRFVSDYEIRGLQNQYHNYGLGVPLIAIRKHHANPSRRRKVLSAGHELSGHGVLARVAQPGSSRRRTTSCISSCTIR